MKFRSILLAEARGSMAGATFSRNGNSAYVRARATPVNPRSDSQTANRSLLNTISSRWRALSQENRTAWIALAQTVPYVNSIGDTSFYSGFQLYMKCNLIANPVLGQFIDTPPISAPTFPAFIQTGLQSEQDAAIFSDFSISLGTDLTGSGAGMVAEFQATGAISAGKKFIAMSQYRRILLLDPVVGALPQALGTPWTVVYGIPSQSLLGARIGVRFRLIDKVSGFASPWTEISAIVTEA